MQADGLGAQMGTWYDSIIPQEAVPTKKLWQSSTPIEWSEVALSGPQNGNTGLCYWFVGLDKEQTPASVHAHINLIGNFQTGIEVTSVPLLLHRKLKSFIHYIV